MNIIEEAFWKANQKDEVGRLWGGLWTFKMRLSLNLGLKVFFWRWKNSSVIGITFL